MNIKIASLIAAFLLAKSMPSAAITPGNGVFIDDVSYDMSCATNNTCTNTIQRLTQYPADVSYLFPDFGYIDVIPSSNIQEELIQSTCGKVLPGTVATYFSMPMISPEVLVEPSLGQCQPGPSITAHYAQQGKYRVLPLFTAASSSMFDQASIAQLQRLAAAIAQLINKDPNASGVSFDIEPAFHKSTTTSAFFGTLAKQLSGGKILAIFDANRPDLEKMVKHDSLNNVLVLQALYDYGEFPGYNASQAIPLADYDYQNASHDGYAKVTQQYARAYFGDTSTAKNNIPVMFVLPGSATSTIWSELQFYNQGISSKGPGNPYPNRSGQACLKQPPSWLNSFLTTPSGTPGNNLSSVFVGAGHCSRYLNENLYTSHSTSRKVAFIDYFNASLNAVSTVVKGLTTAQKAKYIGSALYTMRAAGPQREDYNDIDCAKHYYSVYGSKSLLSKCIGVFPSHISDSVLQAFDTFKP